MWNFFAIEHHFPISPLHTLPALTLSGSYYAFVVPFYIYCYILNFCADMKLVVKGRDNVKLEDFENLAPGDVIEIVSNWENTSRGRIASDGKMDKWCGCNLTVDFHAGRYIIAWEDKGDGPVSQNGHWHWFPDMISRKVSEASEPEYESASNDEIIGFLMGSKVTV